MASSALRRSFSRRSSLHRALAPNPRPPAAAAAGGAFRRSFQSGDRKNEDEFMERVFGARGQHEGSRYEKIDRFGNTRNRLGGRSTSGSTGVFDSLEDGMRETLVGAAHRIQMDEGDEEDSDDDFEFRPDVQFRRGSMYNVRDLDLTRPAAAKNPPRPQFETTTEEVLRKADFRNVRFLSHFLTESGIMIKRSQTCISAKAQRKVAREIKTARAFGLMPFTTMGRRPFIFGRSAEEHYSDEEYGHNFVQENDGEPEEDNEEVPDPVVETA